MALDPKSLGSIALFENIPLEQLSFIAEKSRQRTYKADEAIVHQDDPGETFYVIMKGTVKISTTQADGSEVFIALLATGDTFGELSMIDTGVRSADVITQEETTLISLDRRTFEVLTTTSPEFTRNLLKILTRRLRLANGRIQALCTEDVDGRVVRQLCEFGALYGLEQADSSIIIPVRLTQGDISDLVGASRERVNQVMKFYRDKGIITVDSGYRITIKRPQAFCKRFQ